MKLRKRMSLKTIALTFAGFLVVVAMIAAGFVMLARSNSLAPRATPSMVATASSRPVQQEAMDYLTAPQRAEQFKALFTKADARLAQGLENGTFGTTEIHDAQGNIVDSDYTGLGTLSTPDRRISVKAQLNKGRIDYDRPFQALCVTHRNIVLHDSTGVDTETHLVAPLKSQSSDTAPYWQAYLVRQDGSSYQVTDTRGIVFGDNTAPLTLDGLKELDRQALDQFNANMTSWFIDW